MDAYHSTRRHFLCRLGLAAGSLAAMPLFGNETSAVAVSGKKAGDWDVEYGPYLQSPRETSMKILWTTRKPGIAWVEYWPVNNTKERKYQEAVKYGLRCLRTPKHEVTIKGLKPGVQYAYKVFAVQPKSGFLVKPLENSTEKDGVFTTLDRNRKTGRFFILNDQHCPFSSTDRMLSLLKTGKADSADLIFHNGDILDYVPGDYWSPRIPDPMYHAVIQPIVPIISQVPFMFVRGNHEYRGYNTVRIDEAFPPYETGAYYTIFRQGDVCFLLLDTGEDRGDEGGETRWEPYFDEQAEWLKQAVQMPDFKTASYRVVLEHIPPLMRDDYSAEDMEKHHYTERKIYQQFMSILAEAGINILICAHTHANIFYPAGSRKELKFPILVNDNTGYVVLESDVSQMLVEQFDKNGKSLRCLKFQPGKFS